jgi:hypothetical protein
MVSDPDLNSTTAAAMGNRHVSVASIKDVCRHHFAGVIAALL